MKTSEEDYESKFNDYRDEDIEKNENFINDKLSQLPIHRLIKQIKIDELIWNFDAVRLYPSAMWDENSVCPRIETGYSFTEDMNDELVKKFNNGNFNQGNTILVINYYNLEKIYWFNIFLLKSTKRKLKLILWERHIS